MKRKITLMSVMLASISVSFGQNQKAITTYSTLAAQELVTEIVEKPNSSSTSFEKAGGDVIWLNEFSDANDWTAAGPGANYTENGWSIGTTTNSWIGSIQSTMNTTGAFARFRNGVPPSSTSDGTVISDGPFTLTYNSTIDLTGIPTPLLEFEQYGARFIELQALQISLNGTDWVTVGTNDDISPLTLNGGSVYDRPMTRRYSLAPHLTGDISAVHVRILWDGAMNGQNMNYIAYGWYIDDIRIIEGFENYAVIEEGFVTMGQAGLQYTKIPTTQVTSNNKVGFGAWVKNLGSQEQNLRVVASNSDANLQSSFITIGSQQSDSLSISAENGWIIPAQTGVYDFTLTVENDGDESNSLINVNEMSFSHPFEVTTKIMAVDKYNGTNASITGSFTGWASNASDPGIGTDFEIFVDAELERVQVGIAAIPSASQAQYVGNELFCQVWKFNESTGWELISISMFKTLTSSDFGKLVNLQFEEPIQLQAGDIILPIASFFTGATVPIAFAGNSIRGTTTGIGNGGLIGLAGDGNFVSAPVVRLDFGTYLNIEESAIEAMNVTLYPNPASNNATIAYTLNTQSIISIEVRDLSGKLVYSANENQVAGAQNTTIATDKFAEGMYTYTLTANGSQVTKKFIVKK